MLNEDIYSKIYNIIHNSIQKDHISTYEKMNIAAIRAYGRETQSIERLNKITSNIRAGCNINDIKGYIDEQKITINSIKKWLNIKFNELPIFEHLNLAINENIFNCHIKPHPILIIFEPILSKINIYDIHYNNDTVITKDELNYINNLQSVYGGANDENLDELLSVVLKLFVNEFSDNNATNDDKVIQNKTIQYFREDAIKNNTLTPFHYFALYITTITSMAINVNEHHGLILKLYNALLSSIHKFLIDGPILRGIKIIDTFNYELYYIPTNDYTESDRDTLIYTAFNGLFDTIACYNTPLALLQINTNIIGSTNNETLQYLNLPDRLKKYDSSIPDNKKLLKFYLQSNNFSDDAYSDIFINLIEQCHHYGAGTILLPALYPNDKRTIKQIINAVIFNDISAIDILKEKLNNEYLFNIVDYDNESMLVDSLCTDWRITHDR